VTAEPETWWEMSAYGDEPHPLLVTSSTPQRVTLVSGRKTARNTSYRIIAPTKIECIREILLRAARTEQMCLSNLQDAEKRVAKLRATLAKAEK
jgi:hypothetical protein